MPWLKILLFVSLLNGSEAAFTGSFDGVLWKGGFESGKNLPEYSEKVGGRLLPTKTIVKESEGSIKPRCGKNFLHVKLTGSDKAYDHNRVEIGFHPQKQSPPKETMKGTTRYYGWSWALDSKRSVKSQANKGNFELAYWEADGIFQQTIGFYMNDGKTMKLRTRRPQDKDVGSFVMEEDKWYDVVLGVKWDPQSGWVRLWVNGKEVVPQTSHATLAWGQPCFSHMGLFFYNPSKTPVSQEVGIFYDCVVYAKGYDPNGKCYNDGESCQGGGDKGNDDNDDKGNDNNGDNDNDGNNNNGDNDNDSNNDNDNDNNDNDNNDNDNENGDDNNNDDDNDNDVEKNPGDYPTRRRSDGRRRRRSNTPRRRRARRRRRDRRRRRSRRRRSRRREKRRRRNPRPSGRRRRRSKTRRRRR